MNYWIIFMKNNGLEKTFFGSLLMLLLLAAVPAYNAVAAENPVSIAPDGKTVVSGAVIDKATGEPIIGANVAVWADGKLRLCVGRIEAR